MASRTAEGEAGASAPATAASGENQTAPAVEKGQDEKDVLLPSGAKDSPPAVESGNIKEIVLSPRSVESNGREKSKAPLWRRVIQLVKDRLDILWSCWEARKHLDASAYEKMRSTYWTSRIVFLRALGIVYFTAFLISFNQAQGLIGSDGILPAKAYAERTMKALADATFWSKIKRFPSLFLLLPANDFWIHFVPFLGCVLSLVVAVKGGTNACLLLVLWMLYQSSVSIGQAWFSFAWEAEILEIGFLSIFVAPFWACSRLPPTWPVPLVAVWGCRWLLFRLLLGSGLTKLRSTSSIWRDFSAFDSFYSNQPLPNPFSWHLHNHSHMMHAVTAVICLVVECVAGFFLLLPIRSCRLLGACTHLLLQCFWTTAGNHAFLTWCSCLPAILCLDDHFLSCIFSMGTLRRVEKLVSLSTVGISWPLTQAWPIRPQTLEKELTIEGDEKEGEKEGEGGVKEGTGKQGKENANAQKGPGASGSRGADDGNSLESAAAAAEEEEERTCWCWYRPVLVDFFRRCRGSAAAWDEMKKELREKWLQLLTEVVAAAALLACMQMLALATPAAAWLVVVVFFLAAGLATSSVFLTCSLISHIFVEVVLLLASLQSAINLYTNGPAVWSIWICCCLFAILLIFAYKVLLNAALIYKIHVELLLLLLIIALSVPVVKHMLSENQVIAASDEGNLSIVNAYGLFGAVAKDRHELIIQGTRDPRPSMHSTWTNYEFRCKPGDPNRRPCFLSPYHYRLDWLMWFVSLEEPQVAMRRHPWFLAFLQRLLQNTPSVTKLLAKNPFRSTGPPTALRVLRMRYYFSPSSSALEGGGPWWIIDESSTQHFTLPTEVPGAVEHLHEMRELYYRSRVLERQRQRQEREKERRRLEKRAFETRQKAAVAEEAKRKEAVAAAKRKKAEEEKAKRKEEAKRKKAAAAASATAVAAAAAAAKKAAARGKLIAAKEELVRKAKEAEQKSISEEAARRKAKVRQHVAAFARRQPAPAKTDKEIEAEKGRKGVREARENALTSASEREQRQPEEPRQAEPIEGESGKAEVPVKKRTAKENVNFHGEGVPLRAAPLLSRRILTFVHE